MNKKEVLKEIEEKAVEAEIRYDNCAGSTIYGLSYYFDFISEEVVTAAHNLAGGVGASSGSCGAFCAAQLVIGLNSNPTMKEVGTKAGEKKAELAQKKMIEFREIFLDEFGTTLCPEIHEKIFGKSFDFKKEDETEDFFSIPDHKEKCAEVVGKTARMAAEFILENE